MAFEEFVGAVAQATTDIQGLITVANSWLLELRDEPLTTELRKHIKIWVEDVTTLLLYLQAAESSPEMTDWRSRFLDTSTTVRDFKVLWTDLRDAMMRRRGECDQ